MAIRTYGMAFMSRWQSALHSVLNLQESQKDDKVAGILSSEHEAMKASCEACGQLEEALAEGKDSVDIADVVTKGSLVSKCAHLYVGLAAAKFSGNTQRVRELEAEVRYSVCDPLWAKTLLEFDSNHQN